MRFTGCAVLVPDVGQQALDLSLQDVYKRQDEKSAVGTASVVSVEVSDAKNPQVKIKVGRANAKPVTLAEAKSNKLFAESPLARQGRLSVVPLTEAQYKFLTEE